MKHDAKNIQLKPETKEALRKEGVVAAYLFGSRVTGFTHLIHNSPMTQFSRERIDIHLNHLQAQIV